MNHDLINLFFFAIFAAFVLWEYFVRPALAGRSHKRIAALEDLFDPGTAEVSDEVFDPAFRTTHSISGLLHGRLAQISVGLSPFGRLNLSVATHSFIQFDAKPKGLRKLRAVTIKRPELVASYLLFLFANCYFFYGLMSYQISFWKVIACTGLLIALIVTLRLVLMGLGKLLRYDDGPEEEKWEVSGRESPPFRYSTWSPWRYRPILDKPEIHQEVGHLMGIHQVDLLRAPSRTYFGRRFQYWNKSIVTASCQNLEKYANREFVQGVLTEMITLCDSLEQYGGADDPRFPASPRSV